MEHLTPIQNQALTLIAAGYNNEDIAQKTGVTIRTICRWKNRRDFQKLLRESVSKTYDAALAELVSGSQEPGFLTSIAIPWIKTAFRHRYYQNLYPAYRHRV